MALRIPREDHGCLLRGGALRANQTPALVSPLFDTPCFKGFLLQFAIYSLANCSKGAHHDRSSPPTQLGNPQKAPQQPRSPRPDRAAPSHLRHRLPPLARLRASRSPLHCPPRPHPPAPPLPQRTPHSRRIRQDDPIAASAKGYRRSLWKPRTRAQMAATAQAKTRPYPAQCPLRPGVADRRSLSSPQNRMRVP